MGRVSAIPANLFTYSDKSTGSAQELQNWVHGVLTPAIVSFLDSAAPREDGLNVDISAVRSRLGGHPHGGIDATLAHAISDTYYADRDVKHVGQLFQEAGRSGGELFSTTGEPPSLAQFLFGNPFIGVRTDEPGLDAAARELGAAAAGDMKDYYPANVGAKFISDILAAHVDDPQFCAGFLNALKPAQRKQYLQVNPATIPGLISALSSGQLNRDVFDLVTLKLANAPTTPLTHDDPQAFLQALADNPEAAANFARMIDSKRLGALFNIPPFYHSNQYGDYSTKIALLKVLTVAAGQLESPQEAKELLEKVKEAFVEVPAQGVGELKAVLPGLTAFLTTAGSQLMGPVPKLTGNPNIDDKAIGDWAQTNGGNLDWLTPFAEWVGEADEDAKKLQEKEAGGFSAFFIDIVVTVIVDRFLPEPAGKGAEKLAMGGMKLAIGALVNTAAHQQFEPTLAKMFSEEGIKKLDEELARQVSKDFPPGSDPKHAMSDLLWLRSRTLTTTLIFNHYDVVDRNGKKVNLAQALGTHDVSALAEKLHDRNNEWASNLSVSDKNGQHISTLANILARLNAGFPDLAKAPAE